MTQKRHLEWKDDDATYDLNEKFAGIFPPGRYAGYDLETFQADMVVRLNHDITGYTRLNKDLSEDYQIGILMTRQGAVIKDDNDLELTLAVNNNPTPRIDLIVAEHNHESVIGGVPCVYSVIENAVGSFESNLTNNKQFIIGWMTVPGNTTSLLGLEANYTQAPIPAVGTDANLKVQLDALSQSVSQSFSNWLLENAKDFTLTRAKDVGDTIIFDGSNWGLQNFKSYLENLTLALGKQLTKSYTTFQIQADATLTVGNTPANILLLTRNQIYYNLTNTISGNIHSFGLDSQGAAIPVGTEITVRMATGVSTGVFTLAIDAGNNFLGGSGELKPIYMKGLSQGQTWTPTRGQNFRVQSWPDCYYVIPD